MRMQISVVVATRDRPRHLERCLEAIAGQEGPFDLELCVVNDGGSSIGLLMESFARRHPELSVRWSDQPRPLGQVGARNLALGLARGAYIALCDDDDRWLPGHLRALSSALGEASFAYTDAELVWLSQSAQARPRGAQAGSSGPQVRPRGAQAGSPGLPAAARYTLLQRRVFAWRDGMALLRRYNPIVPSSVLYARALHDRIGPFDEQMAHYWDWDFWLRAARVTQLKRVPRCETLYGVYAGGHNLSADPDGMRAHLLRLVAKHGLGLLPSSNFPRMLDDERLRAHRACSVQVWDGDMSVW
ncbi:MAG: glycosyltransferase [Alicyclobacillus sp.]|nr:glycosyltransferase [Alicyclobacillus sp.]